ncbi:MAG: cysteine synthase family protein [Actinobacteria bacterium]|nr:cysteine synthase family protein [Actinomycetota bacterium]MBU1494769.1 cysteine synthase family protein [Actinomycetota bacterium]
MTTIPTTKNPAAGLGRDGALRRFEDVREMLPDIDNPTPMLRVARVMPETAPPLYLKLEWLNPFGSIKDRTAAYLLADLEERGLLAGREIVEASSGNTAIALAALAALTGTHVTVTIPDGVPVEKQVLLRMLGAEVWPTPDDLCPVDNPKDGAIALARSLAASFGGSRYVMPDQYGNPANVTAHYETTGPEIWRQTEGRVRAFVAGYGTCGTITGVGRFLKEQDSSIRVIAVEPQKGHRLPGLKSFAEASIPSILDTGVIDEVIRVDDGPAYEMTKRLFREEGLMVGPSTGAIVHAASTLTGDGPVVGVSPDSGLKYASYFADILGNEGQPTL